MPQDKDLCLTCSSAKLVPSSRSRLEKHLGEGGRKTWKHAHRSAGEGVHHKHEDRGSKVQRETRTESWWQWEQTSKQLQCRQKSPTSPTTEQLSPSQETPGRRAPDQFRRKVSLQTVPCCRPHHWQPCVDGLPGKNTLPIVPAPSWLSLSKLNSWI